MTTNMKYTRGEWRVAARNRRVIVSDTNDGLVLTIGHADMSNHINKAEAVSNARLMAAAPELLAACEWALEQFEILANAGKYPDHMLKQNGGQGFMPLINAIMRTKQEE